MTDTRKEDVIILDRVSYIHYLVQFQKRGKKITRGLINFINKLSAISPTYTKQLGLQTQQTNVGFKKLIACP